MKARIILFSLFLVFIFTGMNAYERGPVAVSPGSDSGVASVGDSCPTFSWTAVSWATGYKVVVFEAASTEVLTYDEMEAMVSPVLIEEIRGPALSWTPSADERLRNGGEYVWYVQAVDVSGIGVWSEGRMFKVEVAVRLAGIEEKVRERLMEYGVAEEVITDVFEDVKSELKEVVLWGVDTQGSQERVGIQGTEGTTNTFYGLDAGTSTIGTHNTFMGKSAGYSNTSGNYNTFLGSNAGLGNTTAFHNVFIGFNAGKNNTTGLYNTFLGSYAGYSNTTADYNTSIGYDAGYSNTTGAQNAFIGLSAGSSNTTGLYNTFLGYNAGYYNTTAGNNTFIGRRAGFSNTTGQYNTFIGSNAGYSNTTGSPNTFIGGSAGYSNTIGVSNTFIGNDAGYINTEGISNTFIGEKAGYNNTTASSNTFLGYYAGYSNTTGNYNTFLGDMGGENNTTGGNNTFIGQSAGNSNNAGGNNTFIGQNAGASNTTAHYNTFIGSSAGQNNSTGNSNVFLGYQAGFNETGSNKLYIDNSNTSSPLIYGEFDNNILAVNGQLGIGTQSPGADMELQGTGTAVKYWIERTDGATAEFVAKANNITFGSRTNHGIQFSVNSITRMHIDTNGDVGIGVTDATYPLEMGGGAYCTGTNWVDVSSREYKENITSLNVEEAFEALEGLNPVRFNYKKNAEEDYVGFIAEDVPELVATKDRKGISTMDVVAVLTKVVQEQQKTDEEQKRLIQEQQKVIQEQKKNIQDQEKMNQEQQRMIKKLQKRIEALEKEK